MPRWVRRVLIRIHRLAEQRKVRLTDKARHELIELGLGLDRHDCSEVLAALTVGDAVGRIHSHESADWMYVFKPLVAGNLVYVKLILRGECIIVSFHEEKDRHGNQGSA